MQGDMPMLLSSEPWFWLQPAVTGGGALLVLLGAGATIRQRYRADRRDQWWRRTQWALELVVSGDEDAVVLGLQVLEQQVEARTADAEDATFIAEVLGPLVDSYNRTGDTDQATTDVDVHDVAPAEGDKHP